MHSIEIVLSLLVVVTSFITYNYAKYITYKRKKLSGEKIGFETFFYTSNTNDIANMPFLFTFKRETDDAKIIKWINLKNGITVFSWLFLGAFLIIQFFFK